MDWKLFGITFAAIFLAELGDKTQLATMGFAAQNSSAKWVIFAASALALTLTSFLGVIFGSVIANHVPPMYIKIGSAILFVVIAVYLGYDAYGDISLRKYEKVVEFLLEKSKTDCVGCAKFQQALKSVPNESLVKEFIGDATHPERGCTNCSAAILHTMLCEIERLEGKKV